MVYLLNVQQLNIRSVGLLVARWSSLALLCASVMWASAAHAGAETPSAVPAVDESAHDARAAVDNFHAALLGALQLGEHQQRELALAPRVTALFDVPRIAAVSLGRTWRELDTAQQTEFVSLLTQLIAATYADRFNTDSGQKFVVDDVAAVKQGHVVRTRLVRPTGDDVALDYLLHQARIFNVIADGTIEVPKRV